MNPSLRPILLVEDSPHDLELSLTALERCRLANPVEVARDGVEALDYLQRRGAWQGRATLDPSVVLLDLKLPKIDGMEVLQKVRNDPALSAIPIVVLTSSREEGDLIRSYELGVNAFVVKPIAFDEFMKAVGELGIFWGVLNEPPPPAHPQLLERDGALSAGAPPKLR